QSDNQRESGSHLFPDETQQGKAPLDKRRGNRWAMNLTIWPDGYMKKERRKNYSEQSDLRRRTSGWKDPLKR
ncbi:MAG: hypothetical protein ACOWYE_04560, partial [Desulfatiglandales bacterium]